MGPIPEEIERFLADHIESIDQLEILRVLGDNPDKELAVTDLSALVQAQPQALEAHLAALLSRGLVVCVKGEGRTLWRHGANTPERQNTLNGLLEVYRQRPVTLIKLVYARSSAKVRALAEAFRIRKEG